MDFFEKHKKRLRKGGNGPIHRNKSLFVWMIVSILFSLFKSVPAASCDLPNLFLAGKEGVQKSVPKNGRLFRKILNNLTVALLSEGFNANDTISFGKLNSENNGHHNPKRLIDFARNLNTDLLILVTLFWDVKNRGNAQELFSRVAILLIDTTVANGQHLGQFEVKSKQGRKIQGVCPLECLITTAGGITHKLISPISDILWRHVGDYDGDWREGAALLNNKIIQVPIKRTNLDAP